MEFKIPPPDFNKEVSDFVLSLFGCHPDQISKFIDEYLIEQILKDDKADEPKQNTGDI